MSFQRTMNIPEWHIHRRVSRKGLPDGNITHCFRKTSKYDFAIQDGTLCWTPPHLGKITHIPNRPLVRLGELSGRLKGYRVAGAVIEADFQLCKNKRLYAS
jgi:hypothetical protein